MTSDGVRSIANSWNSYHVTGISTSKRYNPRPVTWPTKLSREHSPPAPGDHRPVYCVKVVSSDRTGTLIWVHSEAKFLSLSGEANSAHEPLRFDPSVRRRGWNLFACDIPLIEGTRPQLVANDSPRLNRQIQTIAMCREPCR